MKTEIVTKNGVACVIVHSDGTIITDPQSALDCIMTIQYDTGCNRIVFPKETIDESFFVLSSGLAGEVLQKFVNYKVKVAIVGDFSVYTSKPLHDFIYECNKGREIFFLSSRQEAIDRLVNA